MLTYLLNILLLTIKFDLLDSNKIYLTQLIFFFHILTNKVFFSVSFFNFNEETNNSNNQRSYILYSLRKTFSFKDLLIYTFASRH